MVGPQQRVWKVLRETDGERFVLQKKVALFQENSCGDKIENRVDEIYFAFKNFLYVI
jgi:hypothetical protein